MLPGVWSVQSLERLASVEALPLYRSSGNILIVEIVIGDTDSSLSKHQLRTY